MYQSVYLADRPINVGWGKKETQFHGSEGKPTAANIQEVVSCSYLVTIVLMNANTYNTSWLFRVQNSSRLSAVAGTLTTLAGYFLPKKHKISCLYRSTEIKVAVS